MIRHGSSEAAEAISPLSVAMIKPALRTSLMAEIGAPALVQSGVFAAGDAAVTLSAITSGAEEEHAAALGIEAKSLPQNYFVRLRHPSSQGGLDNGSDSVAAYNQLVW
jgi:hypothetical protein